MTTGLYGSPELGDFPQRRSDYPVQVDFVLPARHNRFFAIPLVGFLARWLLLIPHLFFLVLLQLLVLPLQLLIWIPVLIAGRYPKWAYNLVSGYVRWTTRVQAYFLGLTDSSPPFRLRN